MPRKKILLDHEPTTWEKIQAFFGGYDVENMAAEDVEGFDARTIDEINRLSMDADDEERLDQSSIETKPEDLFVEPDDGILDPMMQDIKLPEEETKVSEIPLESEAPKKVGFFAGIWNSITSFFSNLFKSAPQEPETWRTEDRAQLLKDVEEKIGAFSDIDDEKKERLSQKMTDFVFSATPEQLDQLASMSEEQYEDLAIGANEDVSFEKMLEGNEIGTVVESVPDDVFDNPWDTPTQTLTDKDRAALETLKEAQQEAMKEDESKDEETLEEVRNARELGVKANLRDRVNMVLGTGDPINPSEFRKQLNEVIENGNPTMLNFLARLSPEHWKEMQKEFNEEFQDSVLNEEVVPQLNDMLEELVKSMNGEVPELENSKSFEMEKENEMDFDGASVDDEFGDISF